LEIADALGDQELRFHVTNDLGIALADAGQLEEAQRVLEDSLSASTEMANRVLAQQAHYNLCEILRRRGKAREALSHAESAVALAQDLEERTALSEALSNAGSILVDLDELEEAERAFGQAVALAAEIDDLALQARALGGLGNVALISEDHHAALDAYRHSARLYREREYDEEYISLLGAVIETMARLHAPDIEEQAQHLVDESQKRELEESAAESLARAASVYLEGDHLDEAVSLFGASVAVGAVSTRHETDSLYFVEGLAKAMTRVCAHLVDSSPPSTDTAELGRDVMKNVIDVYGLPADAVWEVYGLALEAIDDLPTNTS
ncbi:MAG: tetratricopeptide repeat protein, partial [Acidobacteria bacterium]|nr:tetratricopeptide repeat protein [Acidobacteriota bacterium]